MKELMVPIVMLACGLLGSNVDAQSGDVAEKTSGSRVEVLREADEVVRVTPEREAAALTFARRHHPELADLLGSLKAMDQSRYEKAVQELFKTSEQLTKLQSRTPERYETDLELWKIDSRIRLLVARSAMNDGDELRSQIKKLLIDRNNVRLKQYAQERDRLETRVSKLNSMIDSLQAGSEAQAEKELDRLLKSVKPSRQKISGPAAARGGQVEGQPAQTPKPSVKTPGVKTTERP
jgi:hypothetical protein